MIPPPLPPHTYSRLVGAVCIHRIVEITDAHAIREFRRERSRARIRALLAKRKPWRYEPKRDEPKPTRTVPKSHKGYAA